MAFSSLSYQSIKNIASWLVGVNIVMIMLSVLSELIILVTLYGNVNNELLDTVDTVITSITWIIAIITIVFGLKWYYRATKNIHYFGAREVTLPKMAVIWWFIPLFHAWEPYRFTQQIWKASNPEITLLNGSEWKNSSESKIVIIWWTLTLVSLIGMFSVNFIDSYSLELQGVQTGFLDEVTDPNLRFLEEVFYIISIISMIFFILMIRKISTRQEIKSGISI
jgi:hypothetical protein